MYVSLTSIAAVVACVSTLVSSAALASPYTPDCKRFRLKALRSGSKYPNAGFVWFGGEPTNPKAFLSSSFLQSYHFTLGVNQKNQGLMFSGKRRILGTPNGAAATGYGPLERYFDRQGKLELDRSWTIDADDDIALMNSVISYPDNRSKFCYNGAKQLFAKYNPDKQPNFKCTEVTLSAVCVDDPTPTPNPSDSPTSAKEARDLEGPAAPQPGSWFARREYYDEE